MGSSLEQTIAILGLFAMHIKETDFTRSKWQHYQLWLSLVQWLGLKLLRIIIGKILGAFQFGRLKKEQDS
ncbi:hypothetical protein PanWU01x14_279720 [Parasponia andersonii]|uniref:Uncharacterized protein n=1 Tax=Parasponia andersonii TaxID=3476 RepID=A0A2P5B1Q1_PARAD|nr:hypothetical protein PanWU01x14_279720 [Parasponia andersonii]